MSPEETLKYLKKKASPRTHRTLDAIYDVCIEQVERNIHDFSYATIAKLGKNRGVPQAQSIRNKTGEHYRALIRSFEDNSPIKKPSQKPKTKDAWIDDIKDPRLKLLVQIQASELAEAKKMLKEIIPPDTEIRIYDHQVPPGGHKLTEPERRALNYMKSDEFLNKWEFKLGKRGDVIDGNGKKVFKVATIDAIDKALKYL